MFRFLCPALLTFAVIAPVRAEEQDLAGVWRNTLEGSGVSFWELTPRKGGGYDAQETGLGNRQGVAKLKDGKLIIEFLADDHIGTYEWHLKGSLGLGNYTQTHSDGQVQRFKTSVRFIGK